MAEQQRNKGQNRGGQRKAPSEGQPQTDNQQISVTQNRNERIRDIMGLVENTRAPIDAVLPASKSFDTFRAIVLMALRKAPAKGNTILDCYAPSIITACLSAAYDGLMPDGREGAIIASNNSYDDKGVTKWRLEARWNPMVAGLRKQILAGGQVSDVLTTIVYAGELTEQVEHEDGRRRARFHEQRGTDPKLWHVPITDDARRGDPVAAYAVAFFHDGRRPTFEVMHKAAILHVKTQAKGGAVWGSYDLEMWRKTVLRRFRKSLPGGNDIVDMEAREMFPDFNGDQEALPAPPRPTRDSVQQRLSDQQGTEAGMQMDLGGDLGRFAEMKAEVDHDPQTGEIRKQRGADDGPGADQVELQGKSAENGDGAARGDKSGPNADNSAGNSDKSAAPRIPETEEQWAAWWTGVKAKLDKKSTTDAIGRLRKAHEAIIAAAVDPLATEIADAFFDANTEVVSGSRSTDAGAAETGNSTPAGDES